MNMNIDSIRKKEMERIRSGYEGVSSFDPNNNKGSTLNLGLGLKERTGSRDDFKRKMTMTSN